MGEIFGFNVPKFSFSPNVPISARSTGSSVSSSKIQEGSRKTLKPRHRLPPKSPEFYEMKDFLEKEALMNVLHPRSSSTTESGPQKNLGNFCPYQPSLASDGDRYVQTDSPSYELIGPRKTFRGEHVDVEPQEADGKEDTSPPGSGSFKDKCSEWRQPGDRDKGSSDPETASPSYIEGATCPALNAQKKCGHKMMPNSTYNIYEGFEDPLENPGPDCCLSYFNCCKDSKFGFLGPLCGIIIIASICVWVTFTVSNYRI